MDTEERQKDSIGITLSNVGTAPADPRTLSSSPNPALALALAIPLALVHFIWKLTKKDILERSKE